MKKLNCDWTGNFLPARWVYSARGISRLQRENSCQRPSLAIHTATTQNQHFVKNIPTNATRAQLFQIQPVSVRLEGLLHKISISGTESQMESPWLERSCSGYAATTAFLHRWNLLGKHLLNTSKTTAAQASLLIILLHRSQMEGTNPASTSAPSKTQGKCWREGRKNWRAGWRGTALCRNFLLSEAFPPAKRTEGPKAQEVNKIYKV